MNGKLPLAFTKILLALLAVTAITVGCGNSSDDIIYNGGGGAGPVPTGNAVISVNLGSATNNQVNGKFNLTPAQIGQVKQLDYRAFDVATRTLEKEGTVNVIQALLIAQTQDISIFGLKPGQKIVYVTVRLNNGTSFWEEVSLTINQGATARLNDNNITPQPGEAPATPFPATTGGTSGTGTSGTGTSGTGTSGTGTSGTGTSGTGTSGTGTSGTGTSGTGTSTGGTTAGGTTAATPVSRLFTNNRSSAGPAAISVIDVAASGAQTLNSNKADTPAKPDSLTKTGNFVYVANAGDSSNEFANSLSGFSVNTTSGALTKVAQTAKNSIATSGANVLRVDSGGENNKIVVALSRNDNTVKSFRVNADGSLSDGASFALTNGTYSDIKYYDIPNKATDVVFVTGAASNGQVVALLVATGTGQLTPAAGSPYTQTDIPGAMTTLQDNLIVLSPIASTLTRYVIDEFGVLVRHNDRPTTGSNPVAAHAIGNFLYVANGGSSNISSFRFGENGLEPIDGGNFIAAGEVFPHSFASVNNLGTTTAGLYVATSNKVAAFTVNLSTGALTALGVPLEGFQSPGDIRN